MSDWRKLKESVNLLQIIADNGGGGGGGDVNVTQLDSQPIDLNTGVADVGTQRITIAQDDFNFLELLHVPRPIGGTTLEKTNYFLIGGGWHSNVTTDYDSFSPEIDSLTSDKSSLTYIIPPALPHCYVISSDAGDNGKMVGLSYWDNLGAFNSTSVTLTGIDPATDYVEIGTNVRMIDKMFMVGSINSGEIILFQPIAENTFTPDMYTMIIPVGHRQSYVNICQGLPQNSRCKFGMLNAKASGEICKVTLWRIEFEAPATFTYLKLWEDMMAQNNPIINKDLSYLPYQSGPISSTSAIGFVLTSRTIGANPSYNTHSLGMKVDY